MNERRWLFALGAMALVGCAPPQETEEDAGGEATAEAAADGSGEASVEDSGDDATVTDASVTDGSLDASVTDASSIEASVTDASVAETGAAEASTNDAGLEGDAASDAPVDASSLDAGYASLSWSPDPLILRANCPNSLQGGQNDLLGLSQILTLTNTGGTPVTWSLSASDALQLSPSSSTLSPDASVAVTVTVLKPPSPSPSVVDDPITIATNPPMSTTPPPAVVTVLESYSGVFVTSPTAVDFGDVPVGTTASQTINVTWQGNDVPRLNLVNVGAPFAILPPGAQLFPPANTMLQFTFSPTSVGPQSAVLSFYTPGGAPPICTGPVPLTGRGVAAGAAGAPDSGGTTAIGVSLGSQSACAVTAGGGVECWGGNSAGELGNNSTTNSSVPVQVSGLTGVTAVSVGGDSSCAVTAGGGVECWGDNAYGELGNNSTTNSSVPVQVSGLTSGVTAVSVGQASACAVTAGGGVECWGTNIGNNSTTTQCSGSPCSLTPVQVTGLTSGVTAVSAGVGFACALTAGGGVWCWGDNEFGQLGNNSTTGSSVPVQVAGL